MLTLKCIQKFRDKNNNIYGYRLIDINGQTQDVKPENLKQAIANKQIHVVNLTLTSDGRLVDTTEKQLQSKKLGSAPQQKSEEQQIKDLIAKAKTLGICKEIITGCNHKCYLISKSETQHIIYIPDDVTRINDFDYIFANSIKELKGAIKVIGGHSLRDVNGMFKECRAQSIDFSSFDTRKIDSMEEMFKYCEVESLDLTNFDISHVTSMGSMFFGCEAKFIDLSSFHSVRIYGMEDMEDMFYMCFADIETTDKLILEAYNNGKY